MSIYVLFWCLKLYYTIKLTLTYLTKLIRLSIFNIALTKTCSKVTHTQHLMVNRVKNVQQKHHFITTQNVLLSEIVVNWESKMFHSLNLYVKVAQFWQLGEMTMGFLDLETQTVWHSSQMFLGFASTKGKSGNWHPLWKLDKKIFGLDTKVISTQV
jgi:hypothetical protein